MHSRFSRRGAIAHALLLCSAFVLCAGAGNSPAHAEDDPLPSWNDTPHKQAILAFVASVTDEASEEFVPEEERIATFDNDGTLWCEKPLYVQFVFASDRVKALAPEHPEWETTEPFASVLSGDPARIAALGHKEVAAMIAATHAGMTTDEFANIVEEWLSTAKHPRFNRPYTECVYQPMLELLAYLRANGFKTYIVSGGGVDFMRTFTEEVYGIPPEQVIGSSGKTEFSMVNGVPQLTKLPEIFSVDDGPGKPENIELHIGRRPIMAFGNSDGDLQMLQWTTEQGGPGFGLILHHTDAEREYAYDRDSSVGRLDKALDEAPNAGWTVVDMKTDWAVIFPPE